MLYHTFLDFDGVIVDSIDECYEVSKMAYYGLSEIHEEDLLKELYYRYRGLVRPAHEYGCLFDAITEHLRTKENITSIFDRIKTKKTGRYEWFEHQFFSCREFLQKDISKWLSLHRLTPYGETLLNKDLSNFSIVTTKNRESVKLLNEYYGISILEIYDKIDYKKHGSKGAILNSILDNNPTIKEAIFVDDAAEHLDSIDNPKVKPLFCTWGYGENSGFEEFHFNEKRQ